MEWNNRIPQDLAEQTIRISREGLSADLSLPIGPDLDGLRKYCKIFDDEPIAVAVIGGDNRAVYENTKLKGLNHDDEMAISTVLLVPRFRTEEGALNIIDAARSGRLPVDPDNPDNRIYITEVPTSNNIYYRLIVSTITIDEKRYAKVAIQDITEDKIGEQARKIKELEDALQTKDEELEQLRADDAAKDQQIEALQVENQAQAKEIAEKDQAAIEFKELTHILAHDLRNPLTVIAGHIQLVLRRLRSMTELDESLVWDPKQIGQFIKSLDSIDEAQRRLGRMITDLVDSKRTLQLETMQATGFIKELVDTNASLVLSDGRERIKARIPTEKNLPILVDENVALRALGNVIENCVKYSPEDGQITIDYRTEERRIVLLIEDRGIGMTDKVREECLKKFLIPGGGLGLSGAKARLERMGIQLDIEWTEVGKGTRFAISIPLSEETA